MISRRLELNRWLSVQETWNAESRCLQQWQKCCAPSVQTQQGAKPICADGMPSMFIRSSTDPSFSHLRHSGPNYSTRQPCSCPGRQTVTLRRHKITGRYGASTLRFPHTTQFLRSLSSIWTPALKMFASPVLCLWNIGLKGRQIISLPGTPKCQHASSASLVRVVIPKVNSKVHVATILLFP